MATRRVWSLLQCLCVWGKRPIHNQHARHAYAVEQSKDEDLSTAPNTLIEEVRELRESSDRAAAKMIEEMRELRESSDRAAAKTQRQTRHVVFLNGVLALLTVVLVLTALGVFALVLVRPGVGAESGEVGSRPLRVPMRSMLVDGRLYSSEVQQPTHTTAPVNEPRHPP
jgi:hypothetical protein